MKKIIISAILATLMLFILAACGEKAVAAENFLTIKLSGTEGDGTLAVSKNYYYATALAKELKGDEFTDYDDLQFQMLLSEACKIEIEGEKEGLSNGDKVTISLNYSKEAFAEVGVVISPAEYTYTVEGLTDEPQAVKVNAENDNENTDDTDTAPTTQKTPPEKVDVFESVDVKFEGVSPYIQASFAGGQYTGFVSYNLSKTAPLKNGDTVTLTATPNDKLLSEKNAEPTALTKEYTVEGFPEYVSNISKYDLTSLNETLAANAEKKVSGDYTIGKKQYSLFFFGYDGGNMVEYWITDETELKLAAQYYFTPKVISESEPSNWNSENGEYSNFLLNIYGYEITATKDKKNTWSDTTDGYETGAQETFTLYTMSDVTNLRDTGDGTLNFDNSEYFSSVYRNPDWLKSADEVLAKFEESYAADYDIVKIN